MTRCSESLDMVLYKLIALSHYISPFYIRYRKFFPVVDLTSALMIASTRLKLFLFPSAMLFMNLLNRLYIDLIICCVSVSGSIKHLCVRLGRPNSSLVDTFHVFSNFSKFLDVKSQSGAP